MITKYFPSELVNYILGYIPTKERLLSTRLTDRSMMQCVHDSITHVRLRATKQLHNEYTKHKEISHLFTIISQFRNLREISVENVSNVLTLKHVCVLGKRFCHNLEKFKVNQVTINACKSNDMVEELLTSCPNYRSITLFINSRNPELNIDECMNFVYRNGTRLKKFCLTSSCHPFPLDTLCKNCPNLTNVHIIAVKTEYSPFDLSGLKSLTKLSISGSNYDFEGVGKCLENCSDTLTHLRLCVSAELQAFVFEKLLNCKRPPRITHLNISHLDYTHPNTTLLSQYITTNKEIFRSLDLVSFPFDMNIAQALLLCSQFSRLILFGGGSVSDKAFNLISKYEHLKELILLTDVSDLIALGSSDCKCRLERVELLDFDPAEIRDVLDTHHESMKNLKLTTLVDPKPLLRMKHLKYLEVKYIDRQVLRELEGLIQQNAIKCSFAQVR